MTTSAATPLGIGGLPPGTDALRPGACYGLACAPHPPPALLLGLVRAAAGAKRPVLVLCADPAALAAELAGQGIEIRRAQQRGSLRWLQWRADAVARGQRAGALQLFDELDHYGCADGALVVVWGLHGLPPSASAAACAAWARARRASLLLVADGADEAAVAARAALDGDATMNAGTGAGEAPWTLRLRHWNGAAGRPGPALPAQKLKLGDDGALTVILDDAAERARWVQVAATAADRTHVLLTERAADGRDDWPADWTIVADGAALETAAAGAQAACCVLDYADLQAQAALVRRVYRLRQQAGRALKIVVRACGLRLRHGQIQLLLALGADAVVDRGATPAALVERVAALQGRIYERPLDVDIERTIAAAMPLRGGYLPLPAFVDEVERAMHTVVGDDSVLVRLVPLPDLPLVDALRYCRPRRPGDCFSADEREAYLFLPGCATAEIEGVLERIFTRVPGDLFLGYLLQTGAGPIGEAMRALRARAAAQPPLDLSDALLRIPLRQEAEPLAAAVPAPRTVHAAPRRTGSAA
ncbi:BcsE family c-di-GMP-binding protein [Solimonas variicoloris]|uniref:BcsE family c-di-GMP-binding protein n=1 Tax=Solimonas variicoloris TaxID=254408 RepID=UPI00035F36E1|nr:BcsE family c-di-GMP-binding protein [Solimonas variicoloris]